MTLDHVVSLQCGTPCEPFFYINYVVPYIMVSLFLFSLIKSKLYAYGKLVSSLYTNIILIDSLAFKGFQTFSYQKTQLFTKSIESLSLDLITYMSFIQLLRSEAAFTLQHIIINFYHIPVFRLQKRNYWQTDKNIKLKKIS